MSWQNFNWLKFEGDQFVEELKNHISSVFFLADGEFSKNRKRRDEELSKHKNDNDDGMLLNWSEDVRHTEQQFLTAMMLVVTYRATESLLNRLLHYFLGKCDPRTTSEKKKWNERLGCCGREVCRSWDFAKYVQEL